MVGVRSTGGVKAGTAVAHILNNWFGYAWPSLHKFMNTSYLFSTTEYAELSFDICPNWSSKVQYCVDHPEDICRLAKAKAQVSEVKRVTMEDMEKVSLCYALSLSWNYEKLACKIGLMSLCHVGSGSWRGIRASGWQGESSFSGQQSATCEFHPGAMLSYLIEESDCCV